MSQCLFKLYRVFASFNFPRFLLNLRILILLLLEFEDFVSVYVVIRQRVTRLTKFTLLTNAFAIVHIYINGEKYYVPFASNTLILSCNVKTNWCNSCMAPV